MMCNHARASLRALKMLGNMHRGLSMANWRLVFNAVCLPVLSYGCQLWANARNWIGLINKCQKLFNEGVKVIAGAFHTAPQEALHELTRVLPARHFFDKLTHTSALRLLRVPRTSQLLACLGPEWQVPVNGVQDLTPGGLAQPFTRPGRLRRLTQCPTALEALAAQIPFDGQRADVVAVPPWEAPNWVGRLNYMGPTRPQNRREWVNDLYQSIPTHNIAVLNVASLITNKGRFDDLRVGAAAALLYGSNGDTSCTFTNSWCMGTGVTQHDVDCFGLAKTAEWLNLHYTDRWAPPSHVYILARSSSALEAIRDIHSLQNQRERILFHSSLTAFFAHHADVGITMAWSPPSWDRIQDSTSRFRALAACKTTPRASLNRVQSASHLKAIARERAFRKWAQEWQATCRKRVGRDSFAYEYAVLRPPDGKNHPLWIAATSTTTDPVTGRRLPIFSRHTTSTALCLAVGHAFTSEYTCQFRPDLDDAGLACPCGWPDHSFYHLLYECRLHRTARLNANPALRWVSESPDFFLSTMPGGFVFCDFLQCSRAAFKPSNEMAVQWDPG